MVEFKDFSRPLSDFPVLFKAINFSSSFQESPLYSSSFQACANPVKEPFIIAGSHYHTIWMLGNVS